MVVWLVGISGAGKSTLGNQLNKFLITRGKSTFLIDGDAVRQFYNNELGYTEQDRRENTRRIMFAVNALSQKKIFTIVCNILPFEDMRSFARKKIDNYNEIYLKKDLKTSLKDDIKNMYKKNLGNTPIVGMDLEFEEPMNSDLTIEIKKSSADESLNEIIQYLIKKYPEDFK